MKFFIVHLVFYHGHDLYILFIKLNDKIKTVKIKEKYIPNLHRRYINKSLISQYLMIYIIRL